MDSQDNSASDAERVSQQTRRGISWSFAGAITTNGMRVVVLAVLGRALTSRDFGIVAAAISVNAIVYGIRDIGVGSALVQRKELDPDHLSTGFAVSLYLGIALTLAMYLAAPLIGEAYGIPESIDVIRVLAIVFFALRSVSSTSRMMCQRAMNFRLIAIVDAASFTAGSIVSIGCALAGAGPWALVAGYVVEELISSFAFLRASPPRVSFRVQGQRFRELLSFGAGQTVVQTTNIVATFGDNVVVGNALGATNLGYYSRAYDLVKFPSMVFDAIVGNVLFPAFSRLQENRTNLAISLRRVAFVNALVLLPASAAIIVLAPEAIRILMGPQWGPAVLPFQILALTILFRTNVKLGGILAQAAGAVNSVAIAYVIYMFVVIGGAMFALRWGIVGVSVSTACAITIVCWHCCAIAVRVSGLPMTGFLAAHGPGLLLAAVVGAMTWPLRSVLVDAGLSAPIVFVAVGGAAVALCLVLCVWWMKRGAGDFAWLASELGRVRRKRTAT